MQIGQCRMNNKACIVALKFLTILIFSLINAHAQSYSIRLFPATNERALVAWSLADKEDQYIGQFILNSGEKEGENFYLYGNELAGFNSLNEIMAVKTTSYFGSEYFPGSTEYTAKIFYATGNLSNEIPLASEMWLMCGVGARGFEEILMGYGESFIYTCQNSGFLSSYIYNRDGEKAAEYEGNPNTVHISMDILPDSTCLIVWFNVRNWEEVEDLPLGIYASILKNGRVLRDSILIKEYPDSLGEVISWSPTSASPFQKLVTLNDSTFQLFILEIDSSHLNSYLLGRNAEIKEVKKYAIPDAYNRDETKISYINAFNISNFSENSMAVFFSADIADSFRSHREYYLYYFNEQGDAIGPPLIDTTQVFRGDYFIYKTGAESFLNPSITDGEARIDTYENFTKISSIKLGLVSSIKERTDVHPEIFQLSQNYPNPFNPTTTINFRISESGHYTLDVYNAAGQLVRKVFSRNFSVKNYSIKFEAENMSSGTYFYKLSGQGFSKVQKFTVLK